ncbi:hypothetical protein JCM10450v2_005904 [Rhodotorula kratochvilovae]
MTADTDASCATRSSSKAVLLPDEVWLLIASNLEYGSLKSLERTCKRLNKLTKDKSLDRVLFRTKAAKCKSSTGASIALHPMLYAIEYADIRGSMQICRLDEDDEIEQTFDPYAIPAVDEFATSPACSKIKVAILSEFKVKDVEVVQAGGVTIRRLFHEMEAFWKNTANDTTCCLHGTNYGKGHTYLSLWDGSSYGMEGKVWMEPKVGTDGAITLSPYYSC